MILCIFYFLLIRPQQKKLKEHQAMVDALRRGDQVVTQGGVVGKVTKVRDDGEVEVEIAGERQRIALDEGTATVEVPEGAEVVIDPDGWLLMNRPRQPRSERARRRR